MKGRPEDYSQKFKDRSGLSDWFVNVFWYHYKWVVFAVAVIAVVVVFLFVDALNQTNYDASVVIAARNGISQDALDEMDELFKKNAPDLNGNGKVEIEYIILDMGDSELGMKNQERIWLCFSDSAYALYLMDESCAELYMESSLKYFDPLANYGLPTGDGSEIKISLAKNALMERAGLNSLYAGIIDHSSVTGDEKDIAAKDAAVAMLSALLEAK